MGENPAPFAIEGMLYYSTLVNSSLSDRSSLWSAIMLRKYRQNITPLTRQGKKKSSFVHLCPSSPGSMCSVSGCASATLEQRDVAALTLSEHSTSLLQVVHWRCGLMRPSEGTRVLEKQSIKSLVDNVLMLVLSPSIEVEMLWRTGAQLLVLFKCSVHS